MVGLAYEHAVYQAQSELLDGEENCTCTASRELTEARKLYCTNQPWHFKVNASQAIERPGEEDGTVE